MSEQATLEKTDDRIEIVSFTIGEQAFCLDIGHVLEIRGWTSTTTLPHAPDYVVGMMNLRGAVLPVIDLSMRLGLGKTIPESRHVIIIAHIDEKSVGFLVDAVSNIITVNTEEMKPTPEVSSTKTTAFIRGVYTLEETIVRAIDVHQIMPQETLSAA
ncbi:chemotaxis protein CheW [Shimia marina]|uniref:Chemotaxis protein CheW n=1 Tax=Shimia marina TaxID=321267 RepID=A0A0P1F9K4_9RHOB|nr:chemotaxis protein CheW [Shimia marina]CUH52176.1 Chemotaxis protein CheW [Shimia marina]SFE72345.1 purine-binding chemotaxis protein CheW [Shimia marina]